MSHRGENFSIPPSYTKWNHKQTIAYFQMDKVERRLEDVIAIGAPDMYSAGNPVQATTTTLKELQVFPQPVQKPHPQIWEPLTSPRSIKWAAEHGINGVFIVEPNDRMKKNIDMYYEAAEKASWPDMLNRGRFKYGWDAQKRRGIMTSRYIHVTTPGKEKQAMDRAARAMELQFDYYGPFGFGAVVARLDEPMFDLNKKVTAEMLREREIAIQGSKQFVIDKIMKMKNEIGYDDFCFLGWFELGGFEGREIEDQMQLFAEEVMPVIARECGGKVELPERGINYAAMSGRRLSEGTGWQASRASSSLPSTRTGWRALGCQPGHAARRDAGDVRASGRRHGGAGRRGLHRDRCRRRAGAVGGAEGLRRRSRAALLAWRRLRRRARCTRIARCTAISPRRSVAGR